MSYMSSHDVFHLYFSTILFFFFFKYQKFKSLKLAYILQRTKLFTVSIHENICIRPNSTIHKKQVHPFFFSVLHSITVLPPVNIPNQKLQENIRLNN